MFEIGQKWCSESCRMDSLSLLKPNYWFKKAQTRLNLIPRFKLIAKKKKIKRMVLFFYQLFGAQFFSDIENLEAPIP